MHTAKHLELLMLDPTSATIIGRINLQVTGVLFDTMDIGGRGEAFCDDGIHMGVRRIVF